MTFWSGLKARFGNKPQPPVIRTVIDGREYPVTEWARAQAAANMKADPVMRMEIERMIGVDEARRRYYEAYED